MKSPVLLPACLPLTSAGVGMEDPGRPIGNFIFLGPAGGGGEEGGSA